MSVECAKVLEETGELLLEGEQSLEDSTAIWEVCGEVLAVGVSEVLENRSRLRKRKVQSGMEEGFGEGWSVLEAGLPVWEDRREVLDEGGEFSRKSCGLWRRRAGLGKGYRGLEVCGKHLENGV